jgi:electron-transferring-flavoprotein dehydrogenase
VLTPDSAIKLPNMFMPKSLHNEGNYIVSLGDVCKWLASEAEELGVEIYPGFAAAEPVLNEAGVVVGVQTADVGIAKDGSKKDSYAPGMQLLGEI